MPRFDFFVVTPGGTPAPELAIAGSRAGAVGVLNLEFATDTAEAVAAVCRMNTFARGRLGVLLGADSPALLDVFLDPDGPGPAVILIAGASAGTVQPLLERIHTGGRAGIVVVHSLEQALAAEAAGADAVIAKGHESGGWVGEETAFVLLQRLLPRLQIPIHVQGGISLRTAAACRVAGAAGVVLDAQLLLTRESTLPTSFRARLETMDGSETACPGGGLGAPFRAYARPDLATTGELRRLESVALADDRPLDEVRRWWRETITARVGWQDPLTSFLSVGQDACFAASLARQFVTVGGVLEALRRSIDAADDATVGPGLLAEGSPLAVSHGTRYPIVQGPMTRVSDRAEFADAVAEGGGLPFLALALMRADEVRNLLEETARRLGDRPWGVGVLGFVPPELRSEQLEVVRAARPKFALIAGGRPDQARILETDGIPTYLHVPSPGLLRMFLQEGARRFVFEGRECGGHVGPRTSFVLWETMVEVLAGFLAVEPRAEGLHVLFAGGIHDGLSAAMVAAIATPLAEKGVKIGVLIGTAYLFTKEAVESGAIVAPFQQAALSCDKTVLLESGPGHATRCLPSPFVDDFAEEKRRLIRQGLPSEELRYHLEELNIGRLRVASKGIDRDPRHGQDPTASKFVGLGGETQWARGMYMIGQVAALRDGLCTIEELHHGIAQGLSRPAPSASIVAVSEPIPPQAAVAIVGMGCILPGAADLKTFWSNILNKVDAITEVPADRWDWRRYFDPDRSAKDRIYSRWGGFIADVPFNPALYGMPPNSLRSIEPFQLLALAVVRSALEDAGYLNRPFPRERTSVVLGAGGGGGDLTAGYMVRSCLPSLFGPEADTVTDRLGDALPGWTEDSFPGLLMNVAAGRVANRFDLGGVNYTVDAACASSLAAVYLAVRELENRTSDVAIAGGVDAIQNPFAFLCFSKTQALSPTGRCRTFDAKGDGIAISEGFAAIVMKRLEDAERDGDRIYGVIRGVGGSSDGRDRSMTAPRPEGQIRALRRAYAQAGYSPATVGLFEAHGTGTVAGDQAEVRSLTNFLDSAGAARQSVAVGSVKSMIGHAKAAAGVAGLIKVALSLHHQVLPATLNVTEPNPKANFPASPLYVNADNRPWIQGDASRPRRAGVSAFGFGGTNFHVAVEEYVGAYLPSREAVADPWRAELLVWRDDSRGAILQAIDRLSGSLARGAKPKLADLAYTLALRAEATGTSRATLTIVARSLDDLADKLRSAHETLQAEGGSPRKEVPGVRYSDAPFAPVGRVAFLFPGQGSQYLNMTRDLALVFPEVRESYDRADRLLGDLRGRPLSRWNFPPPTFTSEEERTRQAELTETDVAQPALAATGIALGTLLRKFGLEPSMTAGHSFGEFVALAAAGCYDETTLLELAAARGRFIRESMTDESGTMAAVDAPPELLEPLLNDQGITLANLNAPRQTVISGTRAAIASALAWAEGQGITARMIPVACAFHSPLVEPARTKLAARLREVRFESPRIPVYSNTTAETYPADPEAIVSILSEHLVRPVEFVRLIEAMYRDGGRIFVEVGAKNVLCGLVGRTLAGRPHLCVATDSPGVPGLVQFLQSLGSLVAEGVPIALGRLFEGRSVRRLDLASIEMETGQVTHSPTTWLVNGGKARPAREPVRSTANGIRLADEADPASTLSAAPRAVATKPDDAVLPSLPLRNGSGSLAPSTARATSPPSQGVMHRSENDASAAAGSLASRSCRRDPIDNGGNMTQSNGIHSRDPRLALPQRFGAHLHEPPPPSSPALPPVQQTVDLVRQFQQVMLRFLDTQQNVMHDLLAFCAAPGLVTPPTVEESRALAHVNGTNGTSPGHRPTSAQTESDRAELNGHGASNGVSKTSATLVDGHGSVPTSNMPPSAPKPAPAAVVSTLPIPPHPISNGQGIVAEPSPATRLDRKVLTDRLLAIVVERTGYPEEMLELDADLEADLGIDSIKRVEIAGTMIRSLALPESVTPEVEKLTASRTLRQVIDNLESLVAESLGEELMASTTGEDRGHPFDGARTGHGIGRFALIPIPAPPLGTPAGLARVGTVVILDDGAGVGERVATLLDAQSYHVVRVGPGEISSPDDVARLVRSVQDRPGRVSAIVDLTALRPVTEPDRDDLTTLFLLTQAFRADLESSATDGGAAVLVATAQGGTFAVEPSDAPNHPEHGALAGFAKSLAHEWPSIRVKAVDLGIASSDLRADWIIAELMAADGLVEVGYRDGRRTILSLSPAPLDSGHGSLPVDGDSVVLITGGARGITAEVALRIAEQGRPTLVLVGRTPLPDAAETDDTANLVEPKSLRRAILDRLRRKGLNPTADAVESRYRALVRGREVAANLDRLREAGARVEYHVCDVREASVFAALIDAVYQAHGRIDGVIHGAGVIEDKLVRDKSLDSFRRVVETKAQSALVLARTLRPEKLRFLVFFGSVSGRFGNRGQADYAAASEILNKLAQSLDRLWPARVVSINWGPWHQTGMASAEVLRQFAERGVEIIPPDVGCRMLIEELGSGTKGFAEVVIGGGSAAPSAPAPRPTTVPAPRRVEAVDYPLLTAGRITSRSEAGIEFVRPFDENRDFYLNDHRIDGNPVLPFAMAMELMAEVAAAGWPSLEVVGLRKIRLLRGVVFDGPLRTLRIVGRPRSRAEGPTGPFAVDVSVYSADHPSRVHYQAIVDLGHLSRPDETAWPARVETAAPPLTPDDAYRDLLFHGPLFQGITSIDSFDAIGAGGVIRPSSPRACLGGDVRGDWLLDPVVIDCGFQMQVVWARLQWDVTLLPAGVASYTRYGSLRAGDHDLGYGLRVLPESRAPIHQADHRFHAPDGRLLGSLGCVEGTGSRALNRLAGASPR